MEAGVKEIIGLVGGGDAKLWCREGTAAFVRVLSRTDEEVCSADIDRLVILDYGATEREMAIAVNSVINALTDDMTRRSGWLKGVPVEVRGVNLSPAARRMLEDAFGSVVDP